MNNSQINNIEWKDGAVCFAMGLQWFAYDNYGLKCVHGTLATYKIIAGSKDFQLNTIKQGHFISVSELDTEQKYNDAVEVFGLFGLLKSATLAYGSVLDIGGIIVDDEITIFAETPTFPSIERKLTYAQLMAIGELKRLEIKRNNTVLSLDEETELKSRAMASELNSQPNDDEWPKVGEKVICNGVEYYYICKSPFGDEAVLSVYDSDEWDVVSVYYSELKKPKTPEDLLIEELQTKLVENNAVDNWMLAANIISGDIDGLTYTSKDGK